ncbi:MAG: prenyltransferase/squalene oxidase repeat-containing protein [bacterium]
MSDKVDMNEVNVHLEEINEMYKEESYLHRLKKMFKGLKSPRQSLDYKEAMIEMQRLSAPAAAVLLPLFAIGVLLIMEGRGISQDRVIQTQVVDTQPAENLDKIEDIKKPEEQIDDPNIQVTVNNPNVQNEAVNQPMSAKPQDFDAVMTVRSPIILKNIYGSTRNTGARGALVARFGGDRQTEEAVMHALRWLKKNQNSDGSWSAQRIAMTGLAVLTFLAHGEKPGSSPEFGETVQKGLEYLVSHQGTDGRFTGMDGNGYAHPIATYALCEAYGMTLNPNVKAAAEKALDPIIKGQHSNGGWDYNMNPGTSRDDTSYMGWCAQAIKAAKLAKIQVADLDKVAKLAIKGFKSNAGGSGGFGYTGAGQGGLTSVGTLCMQLLGASNENEVKLSLDLMDAWQPSMDKNPVGESPQYYFYYATQAKFHAGGKRWDNWNKAMKPLYIGTQKIIKNGIKDHNGKDQDIGWWENGDTHTDRPVMDTCLAALQLMVYYRYLPTTSKDAVKVEEEIVATSTDTEDIKVETGNL